MDRKAYHKQEPYDSWSERRASKMPAPRKQPEQRKRPELPQPTSVAEQVAALLAGSSSLPGGET